MRKIESKYENPIDNHIYTIVEPMSICCKKMNLTANNITTISLLLGILALYFLWNRLFFPFAILYFLSYIFDCLDGYYARKYKQVTKFGDYYDHIKDMSLVIGIILVIYYKYDYSKVNLISILILAFLFVGMCTHMGYQECIYNEDTDRKEGESLSYLKYNCNKQRDRSMAFYTRHLGCGTFVIGFIFLIWFNFFYK